MLEPICDQDPDPDNPAHFIRLTDRKGNPVTMPLNGRGVPAGVCVEGVAAGDLGNDAAYYVSVVEPNTGASVRDRESWVYLYNGAVPEAWAAFDRLYRRVAALGSS